MRYILLAFIAAVMAAAPRSEAQSKANTSPAAGQTQKEIAELRAQIEELQTMVGVLDGQVSFYYTILGNKQDRRDSISLNLTDRTYQRLDMDNGFLLVSVDSAEPYLTGYKLHLRIGNPLAATYSGFKAKVKWSKAYDYAKYTAASYEEWKKSVQEKEFDLADSISSGNWNLVELILTPATAEQLGNVELSISTNTIQLYTK